MTVVFMTEERASEVCLTWKRRRYNKDSVMTEAKSLVGVRLSQMVLKD